MLPKIDAPQICKWCDTRPVTKYRAKYCSKACNDEARRDYQRRWRRRRFVTETHQQRVNRLEQQQAYKQKCRERGRTKERVKCEGCQKPLPKARRKWCDTCAGVAQQAAQLKHAAKQVERKRLFNGYDTGPRIIIDADRIADELLDEGGATIDEFDLFT